MSLQEIQAAVLSGKVVYWRTERYKVIHDLIGQWLITCENGDTTGLTWQDNTTLSASPEEFYIAK